MRHNGKFLTVLLLVLAAVCCVGAASAEEATTTIFREFDASFDVIMPHRVYLGDETGRRLSNPIVLYGGERKNVYLYADDYNNNDVVRGDQGDFYKKKYFPAERPLRAETTWTVSADMSLYSLNGAMTFEEYENERAKLLIPLDYDEIQGITDRLDNAMRDLLDEFHRSQRVYAYGILRGGNDSDAINAGFSVPANAPDWSAFPARLFETPLTIVGVQQSVGDDESGGSEEVANVTLRYGYVYGLNSAGAADERGQLSAENPTLNEDSVYFSAGPLNVIVRPSDTGGEGGDNGGGSCSSLGISVALIIPALTLLRRKK